MKKRILTLVMTMILVVTQVAVPLTSFADTGNASTPSSYGYDETPADSVTVEVTVSNDGIPLMGLDAAETPLAHLEVTVPYFDLGLYDLQQYYRYGTENGQGKYVNDKVVERPTALHLYIYLLERYYLGIPEEDCGTGLQKVLNVSGNKAISYYDGRHAYETGDFNSLTLTGSATSMYMFNFWGHDENLMYYRNHRYPLMSPGWGSCADYILLSEGDRIEVAMFSDWGFYHTGAFLSFDQDDYNAMPGQPLTVQVRGTATSPENRDKDTDGDGTLTPEDVKDQPETPILPYTESDIDVALYNENWERSEAEVTRNGDGTYTIQMPRRVGTYYVMATDANGGIYGANKSPGIAKISAYDEDVAFQIKKEDAKDEIEWYVDLEDYRAAEQTVLNGIIDDAWAKIDAVTDKAEAAKIDTIVAEAKAAMDQVKTDAQLKVEESNTPDGTDKPADTTKPEGEKPADPPENPPADNPTTPDSDKPAETPADKPETDKPADTPTDKPADQPSDEPAEEPADKEPVVEKQQLKAPAKMKASNVAKTGKIKLTWDKVKGAKEYKVYRATSKNGKYTLQKTTKNTSYINTSAKAGKTYFYKVKAVSAEKNVTASNYSKMVKATCDLKAPVVTAKSKVKKQVKLTWKKVEGAKKYTVYRATSKNGKYKAIKTTTKLSYTNKSLKGGKTYYYKVKAIAKNTAANSAFSTVDKCKVKK